MYLCPHHLPARGILAEEKQFQVWGWQVTATIHSIGLIWWSPGNLRSNSPESAPLSGTHAPLAGVTLHMWQLSFTKAASSVHSWEHAAHTSVCCYGAPGLWVRKILSMALEPAMGTLRLCHEDFFPGFSLRLLWGKWYGKSQGSKQDREARKV